MQILGIGTDIVEVERISKAILDEKFINRFLSEKEIKYLEDKKAIDMTYAGRFAAKEAIVKALGCGFGRVSPCDIEIFNNESGAPYVIINNDEFKNVKVNLSISHVKSLAQASAIAFKEE